MTDLTDDQRMARVDAFAAAFETAYAEDDWLPLEAFFTPTAVTELNGARVEGREAVIESLRNGCRFFDRRFDARDMRIVEGPEVRDGAVRIKAIGTYDRVGLPPLELVGEEWFHFEGDRIARHVDTVLNGEAVGRYLAEHLDALRPLEAPPVSERRARSA